MNAPLSLWYPYIPFTIFAMLLLVLLVWLKKQIFLLNVPPISDFDVSYWHFSIKFIHLDILDLTQKLNIEDWLQLGQSHSWAEGYEKRMCRQVLLYVWTPWLEIKSVIFFIV